MLVYFLFLFSFCFASPFLKGREIYMKEEVLHGIVLVRLLVWTSAVKETLVEKNLEARLGRQAVY
jgi:hypothetical protein